MKHMSRILVIIVLLLAVAGGVYYYLSTLGQESTDDATVEGHVAALSARVSGYITDVAFDDNQAVKKDDVLLRVDTKDYQIALDQKKAALASSQAQLAATQEGYVSVGAFLNASLDSARANVASAQANWVKAKADLQRLQSAPPAAYARQELDAAVATEKATHENILSAQANLRSAETAPRGIAATEKMIEAQEAQVARAQGDVDQAAKNMNDTNVFAPFDGVITKRSIEPGTYVQPGQQLATLISNDRWVVANFKESQITHMKSGQKVDIHIDAYPGHIFHGTVDSLQSGTGARFSLFPPENATGNFVKIVQRVPVKIKFTDSLDKNYDIGPGLSVVATVHVE